MSILCEVDRLLLVLFKKFLGRREIALADEAPEQTLEELIRQIQDGDIKLRNQLITDYQPFIAKVTSKFSKRYIDPSRDDEFSIALAAFNEAINQYSVDSGNSFLGFAKTVMTRRLIDYVRKEERHTKQVPYSAFDIEDEEDNLMNPVEVAKAVEAYDEAQEAEARKEEMIAYNRELMKYEITFQELVDISPKHSDSRKTLIAIARQLAEKPELMKKLQDKKMLPIKEVLEWAGVSRKTLERNRKYLIAISLVHAGDYPYLQDYLQNGQ
ncbi:RNA polymerase sigma factor SigI [Marinicrinis sediminis]|uniref:RNA polymerase sigma factor SigI n=1 Tax=Marinicrinis sediminis TaxID=1652465 RepID=A0ABW5R893_9BACL